MKQIETIKPKNLNEVVKVSRQLPKIGQLTDNEDVKKAIAKAIIEVFEFYNANLTPINMPLLLEQFLDVGKNLTIPEIEIFRNKCLQGKYETPYKPKLAPDVYIDWLKQYQFERMEAFENANLTAKIQVEKQPISPKTLDMLKELADKVKPTTEPTEPRKETVYELASKELQSYIGKEFRELWKVDKLELQVCSFEIPYIIHKGQKMFADAYLKARYAEIIAETKGDLNEINKLIK